MQEGVDEKSRLYPSLHEQLDDPEGDVMSAGHVGHCGMGSDSHTNLAYVLHVPSITVVDPDQYIPQFSNPPH